MTEATTEEREKIQAIAEIVEAAVRAQTTLTCPSCGGAVPVTTFAEIPDEQRIAFRLTRSSPLVSAATIGGMITDMDALLRAVARQIRERVHVFIERMEWTDTEVAVHFVITRVKKQAGDRS